MTAVLTHQCNLACGYCYAGRKFARAMGDLVAWRAVSLAFADGRDAALSFFGGEPMLEFPRMVAMARTARRLARRLGRRLHFGLTTNGTLLEERHLRFLAEYRFQVALSLDGLGEDHDRNRPFRSGRGSFEVVWRNLARALRHLPGLRVILVMTPANLEGLPETVEALRALGAARVSVTPDLEAPWTQCDRVRRVYHRLARIAADWPDLSLDPFDRRMHPARRRPSCGFGRGECAVSPRGHLYPCSRLVGADTREELRIGHVESGPSPERVEALWQGEEGPCRCVSRMPGGAGHPDQYRFLRALADEAAVAARQLQLAAWGD